MPGLCWLLNAPRGPICDKLKKSEIISGRSLGKVQKAAQVITVLREI